MQTLANPYNDTDLILGGAKTLGEGLGQMAEQAKLDAPGDPLLDAYINRVLQGEDPAAVAEDARSKGVYDMIRNKLVSQGQGIVGPQATTPDLGWQGGQPAIGGPGSMYPAGGPQGPMGPGAPAVGGQAPQGQHIPIPLGTMPKGSGTGGPGLGGPARESQTPVRQGPVSVGQMGTQQPFNGLNVPSKGGVDSGLSNTQVLSQMAQPIQAPTTGMPQAQWQPPSAQRQQPQQRSGFEGTSRPPENSYPLRTHKQQQQLMGILPSLVAANSRTDVARIKADAERDRTELTTSMRGLVALMRQNGADNDSIRDALTAGEGLDVKSQIAFLNAMTRMHTAQMETGGAYARAKLGADTKGSNDVLKTLNAQIVALHSFLGRMGSSNSQLAPDGSEVTRDEAVARLRLLQQQYQRLAGVPYQEYKVEQPPDVPEKRDWMDSLMQKLQ
ncbi:hypothetical protein [Caudoviricetes sp.]|nr:hypothetical protein [Caudoviricetes sp.]UOF81894.1 hypothetical protein [Caudoviricetes sp.]